MREHLKKHQFKKGNAGGPGRPRLTEEDKKARAIFRKRRSIGEESIGLFIEAFRKGYPYWQDVLSKKVECDPQEVAFCAMFKHALKKGDWRAIDWIFDRTYGKEPQRQVNENIEKKEFDLSKLSDDELDKFQQLATKAAPSEDQ